MVDSHASILDSNPDENILFVQNATCLALTVDILGHQRHVHLLPYLGGMGCKKRTLVFEMEDGLSVTAFSKLKSSEKSLA